MDKKAWWVYVLKCADGTYYTGATTDVKRRVAVHNAKKGARYTRSRVPVLLVFSEKCPDRSAALKREYQIRTLSAAKKASLS